jgi:hypothetical protein
MKVFYELLLDDTKPLTSNVKRKLVYKKRSVAKENILAKLESFSGLT